MSIKTILALFSGEANEMGALHTAFAVAREHEAAVRILHVAAAPIFYETITNFGETPPNGAEKIDVLEKVARDLATAAQAYVADIASHHGFVLRFEGPAEMTALQAQFRTAIGAVHDCLPPEGRTVDLIVTAYDNSPVGDLDPLLAAVFDTGRPVLAVPRNPGPNFAAGHFPDTVVLAWDGSLAAGRAMRDAVPIMRQARTVYVICAEEGSRTPGATGQADLMAYLHSHAVWPESLFLPKDPRGVGAALLAQSEQLGADLLVMGAYGTSHIGEMILGGASNHVIKHTSIPLLLSH